MNKRDNFAVVPRPPGSIEKAEPGAKRILSGMVAETLALAIKEQSASPGTKFRIGDYEWCEPDYRQILLWAKTLGLKPEDVVAALFDKDSLKVDEGEMQLRLFPFFDEPLTADGRLLKVTWDSRRLSCSSIQWIEGLRITHVRFIPELFHGAASERSLNDLGALPLPELISLSCPRQRLTALDLSRVPQLRELRCYRNRLKNLELACVPELISLDCEENEIEALDLLQVPKLEHLLCSATAISELNFSRTPELTTLSCEVNYLNSLVLSGLHRLKYVWCRNALTELSLSDLPSLEVLGCDGNVLTELDLSQVPQLTELYCSANAILQLDFGRCPQLRTLDCSRNRLLYLDLWRTYDLTNLNCANNLIEELNLSRCPELQTLDCSGNRISTLDIRDLKHLETLIYDERRTKLLRRPDQDV